MINADSFTKVYVSSVSELHEWLAQNHYLDESFWLVTYKKSVPSKYISTSEVLDELISFGWIDGVRKKLDADRTMQLISKRKTQHWAKTYKIRAARLIDEKRMQPTGMSAIEKSKKNGMWNFMDDVDNLIIPNDLLEELNKNSEALQFFHSINDSSKRFVLRWIKLAKSKKTRDSRIAKIYKLSIEGKKLPGS